jgi:hypothetical protein
MGSTDIWRQYTREIRRGMEEVVNAYIEGEIEHLIKKWQSRM